MQDYITRARLAGEPPHVMLVPRLRHIGLMEFYRAKEAIAEGRLCVEQALPQLLPADATARRAFSDMVQATVAATGKLNADGQRRLSEVKHLLATGTIASE